MILYNITTNIEQPIASVWLKYMREIYVPAVMDTKLFFDFKIFRLINDSSESGITFSIQFFSNTFDEAELYLEKYAPQITALHNRQFLHQQVSFMTMLELVD